MSHPALRLRRAVDALRADLHQRYPVVIDSTTWSWCEGAVRVEGAVLVPSQASAYQDAVAAALGEGRVPSDIPRPTVLSDLSTSFTVQSWAPLQGTAPVDVWAGPEGDDLQTQWTERAVVRVFLREEGRQRVLIQLPDATVGWVARERVGLGGTRPSGDPWRTYKRPGLGRVIDVAEGALEKTTALARGRLGRPYRWGGNTVEAADCSGFVQGVVWKGAGVLLPKNTRDQMTRGSRVAQGSIRVGDLVFVRGKERAIMHVGLALRAEDGGVSVAHSCLSRGRVIEEPLAEFLARYRFTAARRLLSWPEAEER